MRERQPGAAARGQPGGGAVRLRTRAETHRRKWRAGAGTAKTFAWRRQPGGQCKIRPRGGEAGGDGDGEGETLVRLAPPSLGSPGRLRRGRAARAWRPIWDPTAPPPWPPRTSPHPSGVLRGEAEAGVESAGHFLLCRPETRCHGFSGGALLLAPVPPSHRRERPPSCPVPGSQACGHAQGPLEKDPPLGVRARILVGSFFRFRAQEGDPLVF